MFRKPKRPKNQSAKSPEWDRPLDLSSDGSIHIEGICKDCGQFVQFAMVANIAVNSGVYVTITCGACNTNIEMLPIQ